MGKKKDKLSPKEIEREYGFAYSFFKSDHELWSLLQQAIKGGWGVDRFQAGLKNTKWFKKHADTWRQNTALQYSDPATFNNHLNAMKSQIGNLAGQWGATLSPAEINRLAHRAILLGWSSDQIMDHIAHNVRPNDGGHYGGQLSSVEEQLRKTAEANGVNLNDNQLQSWMRQIVHGNADVNQFESYIRDIASKTFGAYGDQIKAGVNAADLAAPYMQSMADILEMNPASITMKDPTIRKAMSYIDPQTGKPSAMSVADFEDQLRADPRFQYTDGARHQMKGYAEALGKMFGVIS